MTKRGEQITVTCAGCGEAFTYTFDRGRIRRFHPEDHKGPDGVLTNCRWSYSNAQREERAREAAETLGQEIEAEVERRLERAVRRHLPLSLTEDDRADLLQKVAGCREALAILGQRSADRASAATTLRHYRDEVKQRFVPILDRVEAVLRRT